MSNMRGDITSEELWAVTNEDGSIVWTRGGSSTASKLMVYESENKAYKAFKSHWIQKIHDVSKLKVIRVFKLEEPNN